MIARNRRIADVLQQLKSFPVVGLLGARQVGKSTLARQVAAAKPGPVHSFDLENPETLARLAEPQLALAPLRGLVILDEDPASAGSFPCASRAGRPSAAAGALLGAGERFARNLLAQPSETLAGRIAYGEISGFDLSEIPSQHGQRLWLRGGFPRSFLARSDRESFEWRRAFVRDFLERDLPQLGFRVPAATMRRFWSMLAHYHGQIWNASEFGRAFGVSDTTVRRYLDQLVATFALRLLPPWHENISKRQVRSPRTFVSDPGLLHTLLGLENIADVLGHAKVGASWEGFVIEQVIRQLRARPEECYFWRAHTGAELDLLVVRGRRRVGFEIKRTTSPTMTPSVRIALADLKLDSLTVVHAGEHNFLLEKRVRAVAFGSLLAELEPLG